MTRFTSFCFCFLIILLLLLLFFSGFCHTLTCISLGFTCVPHPDPHSHLSPHPTPLGLPSAPALSTCLMHPRFPSFKRPLWLLGAERTVRSNKRGQRAVRRSWQGVLVAHTGLLVVECNKCPAGTGFGDRVYRIY